MKLAKIIAVACVCVPALCQAVAVSDVEYQTQFSSYVKEFNKQYTASDFFAKFETFKYWVDFVEVHNAKNLSWTAGINQYSDLTEYEFEKLVLNGLKYPEGQMPTDAPIYELAPPSNDVDWRSSGAVTPVKNQGQCGSCWAFSTTGTMEGFVKIKTGTLPNLSEQQLVDCDRVGGCQGCQGGLPSAALKWIAQNKGLCAQSAYAYTGRDGACKKTCAPVATISASAGGRGEPSLQTALDKTPVSVAVDASGGFQSYKSGVFNGPCGTRLNHAVLAVGYNSQYWIIKNSWGTTWGSNGYIFIARGKNLCGLSNDMCWPTA